MTTSKPTTILTGFLGSGKTTYLNYLLKSNPNIRYAIIENEYGEQSIDSELIIRAEDGIIELNNGCLCCTLNDNLYDILNTLFERREEYDEIIIEATGVADPRGLAEPFIIHPSVKKQFPLNRIICMVDAEFVFDQLNDTKEAIQQITFSDILLINKTDLVSEIYLKELNQSLRQLNPLALILQGHQTDFPLIKIQAHNPDLDEVFGLNEKDTDQQHFPLKRPHHHHHHEHTDNIQSLTLTFDQPFDYKKLHYRLLVYLMLQSKDLYRMKGLIWIGGSGHQHILQSVGKRLVLEEKRPWEAQENKQSRIVLIGKNLQRAILEKMFAQCVS